MAKSFVIAQNRVGLYFFWNCTRQRAAVLLVPVGVVQTLLSLVIKKKRLFRKSSSAGCQKVSQTDRQAAR